MTDEEPVFDGADFWGILDRGSIKFTRTGELRFSLVVPASHLEQALPVRYLARNPMPLRVQLSVLELYKDQVAKDEEWVREQLEAAG